jgi:hypothetical protein
MTVQTLTIGKQKFVLVAERDFKQLQRRAQCREVRPDIAEDAMKQLARYRKTRKAKAWEQVKRRLGL